MCSKATHKGWRKLMATCINSYILLYLSQPKSLSFSPFIYLKFAVQRGNSHVLLLRPLGPFMVSLAHSVRSESTLVASLSLLLNIYCLRLQRLLSFPMKMNEITSSQLCIVVVCICKGLDLNKCQRTCVKLSSLVC